MKNELKQVLEKWDLLRHPFYQAWSAGTLGVEGLALYAREYGPFIRTLERGWTALGDPETAQEEREHAQLWDQFTEALETAPAPARLRESIALTSCANELFRERASTLGAMYAFEAQQPATAESKLHGLRTHYALPAEAERYFELHCSNGHEAERLLLQLGGLSPAMKTQAASACESMAEALWNALTGIHHTACPS